MFGAMSNELAILGKYILQVTYILMKGQKGQKILSFLCIILVITNFKSLKTPKNKKFKVPKKWCINKRSLPYKLFNKA